MATENLTENNYVIEDSSMISEKATDDQILLLSTILGFLADSLPRWWCDNRKAYQIETGYVSSGERAYYLLVEYNIIESDFEKGISEQIIESDLIHELIISMPNLSEQDIDRSINIILENSYQFGWVSSSIEYFTPNNNLYRKLMESFKINDFVHKKGDMYKCKNKISAYMFINSLWKRQEIENIENKTQKEISKFAKKIVKSMPSEMLSHLKSSIGKMSSEDLAIYVLKRWDGIRMLECARPIEESLELPWHPREFNESMREVRNWLMRQR